MRIGIPTFLRLLVLLLWAGSAAASPLTLTPENAAALPAAAAVSGASRSALLEGVQELSASSAQDAASLGRHLAEDPIRALRAAPIDAGQIDLLANPARPIHAQLRSILNVENRSSPPGQGRAAGGPRATEDQFDLGISSNEWAREAMQTLLDMTVQSHVNEHGQTAFSVLGLGSFTLTSTGDRSEISLSADDHALFALRRTSTTAPGGAGTGGDFFDGAAGGSYGGSYGQLPPLREAIEYLTEMASHPLSLLVYCIVAVYVLLYTLLSQKPKPQERLGFEKAASSTRRRKRSTRRESATATVHHRSARERSRSETTSSSPSHSDPSRRRRRKRVRIRIRRSSLRHSA